MPKTSQVQRVGIIGGGQLAWMMAAGAKSLGIDLLVQTPNADDPACAIAHKTFLGAVADASVTAQMAEQCDVITFENEFIDLAALRQLSQQGTVFYPQLDCLEPLLDKYDQRQYCDRHNLPSPPFTTLNDERDRPLLTRKSQSNRPTPSPQNSPTWLRRPRHLHLGLLSSRQRHLANLRPSARAARSLCRL